MNDSERELLQAWLEAAGADGQDSDYMHRERQEFLRALLRTVKDGGWLEGYSYGVSRRARRHPIRNRKPSRRRGGTVSTWSERAHRSAEALDMEALEATDPEDVQYGFREGARWQREALLSDESVERAARALYAEDVSESMDTPWPDYDSPQNLGRPLYEERARNALTAAIGGDDE